MRADSGLPLAIRTIAMTGAFVTALVLARLHLLSLEPAVQRLVDTRMQRAEVRTADLPWPGRFGAPSTIGRGAAVIFSPDLGASENRSFYEGLGFTYIETADWNEALEELGARAAEQTIHTVIVESHGANGNGLKLQRGGLLLDQRSYISLGALQQELAPLGVHVVLLSACNAGRLYRPQIYNALDRRSSDPLFLPPTLGIVDAAPDFDASKSPVRLLRRTESELETMMEVSVIELPPTLRLQLTRPLNADGRLTISTMLMQTILRDDTLRFTGRGFVAEKSRGQLSEEQREGILRDFLLSLSRS